MIVSLVWHKQSNGMCSTHKVQCRDFNWLWLHLGSFLEAHPSNKINSVPYPETNCPWIGEDQNKGQQWEAGKRFKKSWTQVWTILKYDQA